jgi:hypothetical protein
VAVTYTPDGSGSTKFTPVTVSVVGFAMVNFKTEVPSGAMDFGVNDFLSVMTEGSVIKIYLVFVEKSEL